MARLRDGTAMSAVSRAISASAFLLVATAGAALSDDLKGYSIDATYTLEPVAGTVVAGDMPRHGIRSSLHHDRIYVSLLGNVFSYSDASTGAFVSHGGAEEHLDQAKNISRERMQAWTVEPGRLVRVEKVVEGIMAATFVVDPSKTTCSLSYQLQPDPKTGRTVVQTLSGVVVELKSISVSSPSCAVRKGNIFASDQ
jgi:hypothetical protein